MPTDHIILAAFRAVSEERVEQLALAIAVAAEQHLPFWQRALRNIREGQAPATLPAADVTPIVYRPLPLVEVVAERVHTACRDNPLPWRLLPEDAQETSRAMVRTVYAAILAVENL